MSDQRGASSDREKPGERRPRFQHSGPGDSSPPRRSGTGDRQAAQVHHPDDQSTDDLPLIPGEVLYGDGPIEINAGKDSITLNVTNTGDRPVQVGSHYHFAEVNPALDFDRDAAWGRRLNVLAGDRCASSPARSRRWS